ncbi:hypothetical protein BTM22_26185, partial [Vibrio parahaemolyticus]
MSFEERLSL